MIKKGKMEKTTKKQNFLEKRKSCKIYNNDKITLLYVIIIFILRPFLDQRKKSTRLLHTELEKNACISRK